MWIGLNSTISRRYWFVLVLLWGAQSVGEPIVGASFDVDDNLFTLPTKILVFHKETGETVEVSTGVFADVRNQLGKPGKWEKYELRNTPNGSFKYFADPLSGKGNYFRDSINEALEGESWQGPAWPAFQMMMDDWATAQWVTVPTAREHRARDMDEGFRLLQDRGLIRYRPLLKNLWGVGHPLFAQRFRRRFGFTPPLGSPGHPAPRKGALIHQFLDDLSAQPLSRRGPKVTLPDRSGLRHRHLWGFSDDDRGNYLGGMEVVQNGLNRGLWRNMKLFLFYTGTADPNHEPETRVMVPNRSPRLITDREDKEWKRVLEYVHEKSGNPSLASEGLRALIHKCSRDR